MKNLDRNEASLEEERRMAAPVAYEEWAEPSSPRPFLESAAAKQHEIRIRLAEFQAICNSLGEA